MSKSIAQTIANKFAGSHSSSALALGGLAAQSAEIKINAQQAVGKWLASHGLTLPPVVKAVSLKDAKTGKVLKDADGKVRKTSVRKAHEPVIWKARGEEMGRIWRDASGKQHIKLGVRAQSMLVNDVAIGIVAYVSQSVGFDASPVLCVVAHTQPKFMSSKETIDAIVGTQAGSEQRAAAKAASARCSTAFNRARGMLAANGIKVTLPMQTNKGKSGGRKATKQSGPDYKLFNAMTGAALYKHLVDHGVSESVLAKLRNYMVERREAA